MNKLFLIDGHSLIFRMYYAFLRRPMINSKGEDTSILFGFTKYLLELIKREEPSHIAVAFDSHGPTFRHKIYKEYKGTRSETPELIKTCLEPLKSIVGALNIPILTNTEYEADDLIGSAATQYAQKGYQVYMVTPDKDLGQIIGTNIFQYKPGKAGTDNEIIGTKEICDKFNIKNPINVIDILAIWGDSSDNVPGVKGIGEVGAKKLISQYNTVENLLENLDKLSTKQAESIRQGREQLLLSKFLVTIKTDIELNLNDKDLKLDFSNSSKALELFKNYEFPSLNQFLPESISSPQTTLSPREDLKTVAVSLEEIKKIAFSEKEIGLAISDSTIKVASRKATYTSNNFNEIKDILEDIQIKKVGYNLKEYIKTLRRNNISLKGYLADIELTHYLIDPERAHKIDILTNAYLHTNIEAPEGETEQEPMLEFDLFNQGAAPIQSTTETLEIRATYILLPLYKKVREDLEKDPSLVELYDTIEMPLLKVLADMEYEGFKIDVPTLGVLQKQLQERLDIIDAKIKEQADDTTLNISSPKQLGIILYEKLMLNPKIKKNAKGSYPTDEETLLTMREKHDIIDNILEFREIKKLISTYITPLPELINPLTGRIHTTFNQSLTATGRLSSTKPNLQNIPIRTELGRNIRKAFISGQKNGIILSADYSQIELRLMADLCKDPVMIDAFCQNQDIHTATASKIYKVAPEDVTREQRSRAKVANFGIIYGISAFGLSQRLQLPRSEAKELIENYFQHFPKVKEYMNSIKSKAAEQGYVDTIFHRKRYLPGITSHNHVVKSLAERNAINAPIQGSAADLIKLAMIKVADAIEKEGLTSRMILQVHDELIFDTSSDEVEILGTIVKREMENVLKLSVPLTIEYNHGPSWLEAH